MKIDYLRLPRRAARFGLIAACLALAACSSAPPTTFDLNAAHDFAGARSGEGQLVVFEPTAARPLDSERILMRTGPDSVAYLKGAQWAGPLPAILQSRLIASFENAHALRAVGRPGLVANYNLQSDVRRFEADVQHGQVHVEISVKIVGANGRSVASKVFSADAPAAHDDAATVTGALDLALANVLRDIVEWAAPKVGRT